MLDWIHLVQGFPLDGFRTPFLLWENQPHSIHSLCAFQKVLSVQYLAPCKCNGQHTAGIDGSCLGWWCEKPPWGARVTLSQKKQDWELKPEVVVDPERSQVWRHRCSLDFGLSNPWLSLLLIALGCYHCLPCAGIRTGVCTWTCTHLHGNLVRYTYTTPMLQVANGNSGS